MADYISGTLHKRRSGFGKYMAKKWEKRGFVLSSEGVLAYYETEIPPADHNVTSARGFIDLNTTPFHLQTGASIDSMPTPYTIQICPIDGKLEQWKVCTETAGEFEIWRKALEVFATVPQTPLTPSHYASEDEDEAAGAEGGGYMRAGGSRSTSNTPVGRLGRPTSADGGSAADRGRSASPLGRTARSGTVSAASSSSSSSGGAAPSSNVSALVSPQRITPASVSGSYSSAAAATTSAAAPLPVPPPRKPVATTPAAAPALPDRPAVATSKATSGTSKEGIASTPAPAPAPAPGQASTATAAAAPAPRRRGGGLKLKKAEGSGLMTQSQAEVLAVVLVLNVCFIAALVTPSSLVTCVYMAVANAVVAHTLVLRANRLKAATAAAEKAEKSAAQAVAAAESLSKASAIAAAGAGAGDSKLVVAGAASAAVADPATGAAADAHDSQLAPAMATRNGKPIAGCTFTQVFTKAPNVPEHSWSTCDFRDFNVRVGPNYDKYKKKAPSAAPLYEPFAVDVICTKTRKDHISQRMDFGFDAKEVQTNNPHVPPVLVIQMQIPSEPPASMFSTVEDGPGWAIVMYFRITPDTCEQLKDLATASPAVRLFQQYCEKAEKDSAWRARFKVICSCLNMDQMGLPNMIVQYNAKPVLIRRTGTFYRGENHVEFDVHVHKFANLAKQSIHMISSRCGQMYMQIGFVVEGRDDAELPETLFACVGVNKPQEDRGEFLFPEDQEDEEEA